METYIRSLEALGQCQESYGFLLGPVVLEKMPGEIRKQLARENGVNDWVLADLRRAINREIGIMEAGTTHTEPVFDDYAITASFHTTAKPGQRAQPGPRPSNGEKVPRAVIKCAYCDGGHRSGDCAIYTDADSRLKVVKEKGLCFNCLAKHPVAKFSSSNRCLKCKRKHHTTICSS